jgi:competence protein ComEC
VPDHIRLRIDMLSVGDATCTLLRSGDDAMLWDCGAGAPGAGKRRIPRSIRAVGAWRTPTAVITHPNFDHYNALTDAGEPLGVTRLLVPARLIAEVRSEAGRGDGGALPALMSAMEERGVQTAVLSAGDEFDFGACRIEILSPPAGASWKETNDHSLVARIVVPVAGGQRTVLLTGDIQNDAIEALLEAHPDLHADVLEIPHHGAPTDDAYALLALTDPDVVLQSAGRKRAADTRWDAVKTDRRWLTTGRHGAAWVEIRATGAIRAGAMHAER